MWKKRKISEVSIHTDSSPEKSKTVNYKSYFSIKGKGDDKICICAEFVRPQEIETLLV